MSHYAKLADHLGGLKLYKTLRRYFYWTTMEMECYVLARKSTDCARKLVKLHKNGKEMTLFLPGGSLDFVGIDVIWELITTKRGSRYLLVTSERYSKLVWTVPINRISAAQISLAFVHHRVVVYGFPLTLSSNNGKQFTAKFFQHFCWFLALRNLFTTTYHPQING